MRETANLEFKREVSKTFLKTVSAFANYGTGKIVFGVDDDGETVGLDNPKQDALSIENAINDSIVPAPRFEVAIDEVAGTVALTVFEGPSKPYTCKGKAYRRSDSATVEVDRLEFGRLVLSGSNTSFDALEATEQDLRFGVLSAELSSKAGITKLDDNALISLELKSPGGAFNNAAALLADENRFFGTDIARFGDSINIMLSRRILERQSVLKQLASAMDMFDEHYTYEEIAGFERVKRELIPREAFREAIANALVHRAWDVSGSINVQMLPDRIEVSSPGGLPHGVSEESYLAGGPSIVRNPILANVLFRLGHIERFGTGIPRIIDAYAALSVSPSFRISEESVTVVLPAERAIDLTRDERLILDAIPKGSSRTRAEIESEACVSKDKAIRILNALLDKKSITKSGSGRATRYSRI